MTDAVSLTILGAVIIVVVLLVLGTVLGKLTVIAEAPPPAPSAVDSPAGGAAGEAPLRGPEPAESNPQPEPRDDGPAPRVVREIRDERKGLERFPRPPTPVHYRSPTPIHQRPPTPLGEQSQKAPVSAAAVVPSYRQLQTELRNTDPNTDTEKTFLRFHELSVQESGETVDLSQYIVEVDRSVLGSVLALIGTDGDGEPLRYVVARCDKKIDKQLTTSEKQVRKSFRIKHRQSNLCRFARLKITDTAGPTHYRLVFFDYTPYIEEHSPRFDTLRQELSNERSHWESVPVTVHHNTELTNIGQIQLMVPGQVD